MGNREVISMPHNLFQNVGKGGLLLSPVFEASINLVTAPFKYYIKRMICHIQGGFMLVKIEMYKNPNRFTKGRGWGMRRISIHQKSFQKT